jgi:thioredoxin reductase
MQLEENQIKTDGIFITSRHKRNIDLFHGQIELYERNYVKKV